MMFNAGKQINSQVLYENQRSHSTGNTICEAPIIIAYGLRTPDNIASVLRVADAVFSTHIIFVTEKDQKFELDNKIKKISRNTDKELNIEQYEVDEFISLCQKLPIMIAIEITTQSKNIFESKLPKKCCMVIGSENHGIDERILKKCQCAVHIPMYGKNGSMNVSHALAIGLYEWRRQTLQKGENNEFSG